MHVRLVTWDDDPPVGGQGIWARDLRGALQSSGTEVSTLAGRGQHRMPCRPVTGRGHIDMSIALNRRPAILTDGDPDLVHVSGGPGGLQLVRRLRTPVVFTAHHTYRQAHGRLQRERTLAAVEALSYRRADRVVAVSPSTADAVVQMGVAPTNVTVIPSGVSLPPEGDDPEDRQPGRMLFVGRLEPEKGPLDAVAAMGAVIAAWPSARGFVVGQGSLSPELARVADSAGAAISFLGRLSDEEVARQYRRAQVVLVPSQYEGLGVVALEAMAAGAAVVAYDVVGLRDTVGRRGLLVPRNDIGALAAATTRLLRQDALRQELVERAAEHVRVEHSWLACAARYQELYRDLVGSSLR